MTRKEALQERYEDALFALIMEEVSAAEGRRAREENERLKGDPTAEVPETLVKRCQQTIRRQFTAQKAKEAGRFTAKAFSRVAMAAGVAAMLFTGAFAMFDTVRADTLNLVAEVFGESMDFYFAPKSEPEGNADEGLSAGWLPEGFVLEGKGEDVAGYWCSYRKSESESIYVEYTPGDGSVLSADAEDADAQHIEINGIQAALIEKGDEQQIVWKTKNHTALIQVIGTGMTREELIHVAEEIKY